MDSQYCLKENRALCEKSISYNDKLAPLFIRNILYSLIPEGTERIYVLGIGSNMISGDSLGPLVGTLLSNLYPKHLTVFGNLQHPLDGVNFIQDFSQISVLKNSFVIAIDSVLGPEDYVNTIVIREGALHPGEALGKKLNPVGDCSMMGVVLKQDHDTANSLLYTNLHLIYTMAMSIAKGISLSVRQYFHYPANHPILNVR
ncbi:spore protease YyaC [Heyndrickxia ginsengihumi]|uniref:spore protease YyaC n=1 Tax=Heyndrickxia ginsengihumi TaxID=363870 RepID=UPI003D1FCE89